MQIAGTFMPAQRASFIYWDNYPVPTDFHGKNALVVVGRSPVNDGMVEAAAAGTIVAVYIDITVRNIIGKWHQMFFNASDVGPAVGDVGYGTSWGPAADIRAGGAWEGKYEEILNRIADSTPGMSAILCDDAGPGWSGYTSMPSSLRAQMYEGQVAAAKIARRVADQRGFVLITNGMWQGVRDGGYPDKSKHGCSLYDLSVIEHHDSLSERSFWREYMNGQWNSMDKNGNHGHLVIASTTGAVAGWMQEPDVGWVTVQKDGDAYTRPWSPGTLLPMRDLGISDGGTTPPPPPPPVLAKPAPPTGLSVVPGDTTLAVTWNASPAEEQVTSYQVYLNETHYKLDVTGTSYTITGLNNDQMYQIRVGARNASTDNNGYGDWTTPVPGMPKAAVEPPPAEYHAISEDLLIAIVEEINKHTSAWKGRVQTVQGAQYAGVLEELGKVKLAQALRNAVQEISDNADILVGDIGTLLAMAEKVTK